MRQVDGGAPEGREKRAVGWGGQWSGESRGRLTGASPTSTVEIRKYTLQTNTCILDAQNS